MMTDIDISNIIALQTSYFRLQTSYIKRDRISAIPVSTVLNVGIILNQLPQLLDISFYQKRTSHR